MSEILLRVMGLKLGFKEGHGVKKVLEQVSFQVKKGEIFGIVGESGCGKSLTALSIAQLLPKNAQIMGGSILFQNQEILGLSARQRRDAQGKDISMVFQEPMTSLNPLMTIGKQIAEPLKIHFHAPEKQAKKQVYEMMSRVGLKDVERLYKLYPHQLSGGMRQRVMIAMALICKPKLLIADEPTTALDVTVQAQILQQLKQIVSEINTAVVFISHDLEMVRQICNRVAIMYAGSIIEEGAIQKVFTHPVHPYTKGLSKATPRRESRGHLLSTIAGNVPSRLEGIRGCLFASRCDFVEERCLIERPSSTKLSEQHQVSCILSEKEDEIEYII